MHGVLLSLLAGPTRNFDFIPRDGGALDTIVHKTYLTIAVAGFPKGGYTLTLIGLLVITIIAIAANGITEKLTGKKVGSVTAAVLVTILGSAIASAYVLLPFDFALEGVRIIAALLGAIVISVFYTLIKAQSGGGGGKH